MDTVCLCYRFKQESTLNGFGVSGMNWLWCMNHKVMQLMIIVVLVGSTFYSSLGNGFVWDDVPVIVDNPLFSGKQGVAAVLSAEDTIPGLEQSTGYYRPLTYLSFYADKLLWGDNPSGFHFTSLLVHIAVALSLYVLLYSLLSAGFPAFIATLLFALNPVVVETVCFISGGRNTLLCALFIMLGIIMHRRGNIPVAVLCTFGAVASKEFGYVLPLILVIHDALLERKLRGVGHYLPHLAPIALLLIVQRFVAASGIGLPPVSLLDVVSASELMLRYLIVIVVPVFHKVAYMPDIPNYFSLRIVLPLTGICCLAALAYRIRANRPVMFGLAWFLLFLIPALLLATRYKIPMADRHAYLPALGIAMIAAWGINALPDRRLVMVLFPVVLIYGTVSFVSSGIWHDDGTLFERMVRDAPQGDTGYTRLAMHYLKQGDLDNSLIWLDRGESAGAFSGEVAKNIRLNMLTSRGEALVNSGRAGDAERLFLQALHINPDFVPAIIDIGGIAARLGDTTGAIRYFARAAELQPENPLPHFNLSEAYRMRSDMKSAERSLREYRRLGGRQ